VWGVQRIAALAVLLAPAVASAEPDPGVWYATVAACGCGAGVRGEPGHGGFGFDVAAAGRYGHWWFRGALTDMQMWMNDPGHILLPRVGVERRTYDNPHASAFFGIDVGMVDGTGSAEDTNDPVTIRGAFVMSRAGIEGGGEHVRIRLSFELGLGYGHAVEPEVAAPQPASASGFLTAGALLLGFTVR
jgi:hypothetical protein